MLVAILLWPGSATAEAKPGPLRLVVAGGSEALDPAALRARVEHELGRPVGLGSDLVTPSGAGVVTVTTAGNELTVSYQPPHGEPVTRTIALAADDDVATMAVLLAGNVVRDQVTELLAIPGVPRPAPMSPPAPAAAVRPAPQAIEPEPTHPAATIARRSRLAELMAIDRMEAVMWSGTLSAINVGAQLSTGNAYALVSASGHVHRGGRMLGPGLALGIRIPRGPLAFEIDVGGTFLYGIEMPDPAADGSNASNTRIITRLRAAVVYSPHPRVSVFAGVAEALTTMRIDVSPDSSFGPELLGGIRL
jgi:hypothetical protein